MALELLQQQVHKIMPPLEGEPVDLLLVLYISVLVLVIRVVSDNAFLPPLARFFKSRAPSGSDPQKLAYNVFNNMFIATSAGVMTVWAWYVMLFDNGGCTPFNTKPCLANWPDISVSRQFKLVWLTVFGFYGYEMLGTALGVGCVLSMDMVVHHIITMIMMLYGYFYGLGRYGLMATALLDMSNTLLHLAKSLNHMVPAVPALEGAKDLAFKAFALTFFLCRVVLPPFSLIKPGLLDGRQMPPMSYYITNGLLLFIYSLQLFWFRKIVRIAMGLENGDHGNGGSKRSSKSKPVVQATATAAGDAHTKEE